MIRYKFTKMILILDGILAVYAFGTAIFSALKLAGALGMRSFSLFIDIASIIISIGIIVCVIIQLVVSKYKFADSELKIYLLFFGQKIPYSVISMVSEDSETKEMILYYVKDRETAQYAVIPVNIDKSQNENFVARLREKNSSIIYKLFSKETKDFPENQ